MIAKAKKTTPGTDAADAAAIAAEVDKLIAERRDVSSAISDKVRAVSFGVLAIIWVLLNGTDDDLEKSFGMYSDNLLWIAALSVVALLLDFVQSRAALAEINASLADSEDAETPDDVGYHSPIYRWTSDKAFLAKVWAAPIAAVWLLLVIFRALAKC